jgi:nitrogen fixation protein NifB
MPLIPQGIFSDHPVPTAIQMAMIKDQAEQILPQNRHCRQCRADAAGILGQDIDLSILDEAPQTENVGCFN